MADKKFIQKATAKMKKKGTLGSFGKATPQKIARAKKEGGKEEKKAVFAENMKKIAAKRKREGKTKASPKKPAAKASKVVGGHNAIAR
jgi:hypothetical protein